MISSLCQRWEQGRDRYRPQGRLISPREYDVTPLDEATAKRFVVEQHYSRSYPAARFRFGLYRRGNLCGVAVFSHPCRQDILTRVFPGQPTDSVELGRFVLLDEVPGNGETWFLARCFAELRRHRLLGVVAHSDPMPRSTADGEVRFRGHVGTIYQAFNGAYLGTAKPRTLRVLPDGSVLNDRAISKVRALDQGWRYSAALLQAHGADEVYQDYPAGWLRRWLPLLTRPLRHPGNLRYAWSLDKRRRLKSAAPYPKAALIQRIVAEQRAKQLAQRVRQLLQEDDE